MTERIGTPDHAHSRDGDGGGAIQPTDLNGITMLDPEATDFATALDEAVSRTVAEGTVLVPPVEYTECSGYVLPKPVVIKSLAEFARFHHPTHPTIHKTADAPVIEGGDNMNVTVIGLNIDATGINDTTPAIETHGQTYINHLRAEEIGGGSVVRIGQDSAGDNANLSQVLNVSAANCAGDVVLAENTTADANNINSIRVHVQDHQGNAGWAINTGQGDANASVFLVNSIQDTATNITSGGIRMNSQRCWGRVMRHEGSGPVVDFANKMNYCECLYDLSANGATWNNPNNIWHLWGDSGWNVETRYGGFRFRGGRVQVMPDTAQPGGSSNPALKIGNGGAGFYIDVNGEVNVVDEAGNATIIS